MKKYFIPLVFSFCFIASAMEEKNQLSKKQSDALELICNPYMYPHCMDRARAHLTNHSPEYDYARTDEFVDAVINALSVRFKQNKIRIAQDIDTGLTNDWLKKNNPNNE